MSARLADLNQKAAIRDAELPELRRRFQEAIRAVVVPDVGGAP